MWAKSVNGACVKPCCLCEPCDETSESRPAPCSRCDVSQRESSPLARAATETASRAPAAPSTTGLISNAKNDEFTIRLKNNTASYSL